MRCMLLGGDVKLARPNPLGLACFVRDPHERLEVLRAGEKRRQHDIQGWEAAGRTPSSCSICTSDRSTFCIVSSSSADVGSAGGMHQQAASFESY